MFIELVASYVLSSELLTCVFVAHLSLLIVLAKDLTTVFKLLLAFTSFNQIIVINGRNLNIFYVVQFVFVLKTLYLGKIDFKAIVGIIGFSILYILGMVLSDGISVSYLLTLLSIITMLIAISQIKLIDVIEVYNCYIAMFCLSLVLGFFVKYIPDLDVLIRKATTDGVNRYTGIAWDTNFLALQCVCNIGVLLTLIEQRQKHKILYIATLAFVLICGVLTVSKMFILVLCVVYVLWLLTSKTKIIYKLFTVCGLFLIVVFAYVILPKDHSIHVIIDRVLSIFKSGGGLNSFTTGRWNIWMAYLNDWISSIKKFFIGAGVYYQSVYNGYSAHGFYVEILYQFGIIGAILLASVFGYCILSGRSIEYKDIKNKKRKIKADKINYIGIIAFLISIAALSIFTENTTIMLAVACCLVLDVKKEKRDEI